MHQKKRLPIIIPVEDILSCLPSGQAHYLGRIQNHYLQDESMEPTHDPEARSAVGMKLVSLPLMKNRYILKILFCKSG